MGFDLTIITPFNGNSAIHYFLQSLNTQSFHCSRFEVIVVQEEGCIAEKLLDLTAFKFAISFYSINLGGTKSHSAGVLRNRAVSYAQSEMIVFIDSDCLVDKECLLNHFLFHSQNKRSICCGASSELPYSKQTGNFIKLYLQSGNYEKEELLLDYRIENPAITSENRWQLMYSCNVSMNVAEFQLVGGFDEKGYRCHDMDMAYRLGLNGVQFHFERDCQVIHLEHERSVKYRLDQLKGWKWMGEKHPELGGLAAYKCRLFSTAFAIVSKACETKFELIVAKFGNSCLQVDNYLIVPHDFDEQIFYENTKPLVYTIYELAGSSRLQIKLHRDCWDYGIIKLKQENHSPFFSVVIPFRNQCLKLIRALRSVLKQTFQDFEVILVDDASTSFNYREIQDYFKIRKIRLIHNPANYGQSKSMNIGLANAKGKYIFQLDSDDWLTNHALERAYHFIKTKGAAVVYGNPYMVVHGKIMSQTGYQVKTPNEHFYYPNTQAPRIYKTSILKKIGGWSVSDTFSGRYYEDRLMMSKVSAVTNPLYLDRSIYYVDVHPASLSRRDPIETAAAKLGVLTNEANRTNSDFIIKWTGSFLEAKITEKSFSEVTIKWSVIIVFNRNAYHLSLALQSWIECISSMKGLRMVEVIVVDDSCSDKDLQLSAGIRHLKTGGGRGPAYARNLGAKLASNDYLFFSDEDHIVPLDVLSTHEQCHLKERESVAIGSVFGRRVMADSSSEIRQNIKEFFLDNLWFHSEFSTIAAAFAMGIEKKLLSNKVGIYQTCFEYSFSDQWQWQWAKIYIRYGFSFECFEHSWLKCCSGSLSISKSFFEALSGFSENLKSMEDWDFGIRAKRHGLRIVMLPKAEPFHIVHPVDEMRGDNNREAAEYLINKYNEEIQSLLSFQSLGFYHSFFKQNGDMYAQPVRKANKLADGQKVVALTFDDGPHEQCTAFILDTLKRHQIKATFFLLGSRSENNADLVKRMVNEGHEIGIHSWDHISFSGAPIREIIEQIEKTRKLLISVTGRDINLLRPPYGKISSVFLEQIKNMGLSLMGWTRSTQDWTTGVPAQQLIARLAVREINNSVLLFHDAVGEPKAVASTIDWLAQKCRHLRFVSASEFLNINQLLDYKDGLRF